MKDQWTDRLSEYLDDELEPAERAALEAHLAVCRPCRETLAELERVTERAAALADQAPTTDLWPRVAAAIGLAAAAPRLQRHDALRARRRFDFTLPQLAAAGIALALGSGAAEWFLVRPVAPARVARTRAPEGAPPVSTVALAPSDPRYAAAVAALERALAEDRGRLDTATVRIIEQNLAIIDRAIRDAQRALAADPASAYLNQHLAQEMRRKLELLRRAALLAGAQS